MNRSIYLGEMAEVQDSGLELMVFEIQFHYCVQIWTNILGKVLMYHWIYQYHSVLLALDNPRRFIRQ